MKDRLTSRNAFYKAQFAVKRALKKDPKSSYIKIDSGVGENISAAEFFYGMRLEADRSKVVPQFKVIPLDRQ